MIAQQRNGSFWLVTQVDHALQCEQLARACLLHEACDDLLLACRHHDDGWADVDEQPRWSPQNLITFENWPNDERAPIWAACVDRAAAKSPYAGAIVSCHFSAFVEPGNAFGVAQASQRAKLLALAGQEEAQAWADYALLRAVDWVSLLFCAARPGTKSPPTWLTLRVPYGDVKWSARWTSDTSLDVRTDAGEPVFEPTKLLTPSRRLGGHALDSETALAAAWRCAPEHVVPFSIG